MRVFFCCFAEERDRRGDRIKLAEFAAMISTAHHTSELPKVKSALEEILTCPICLDLLQIPVLLSCPHSMCMHCAQSMLSAQKGKKAVLCPQCKAQTTTIGSEDAAKAEDILIRKAFVRLGMQSSNVVPKRHELKQAFEIFAANRVT
jgi:hypothetical protein